MHNRNNLLADQLSRSVHSLAQLSEALTAFALELMASDDPAVRIASRRMVSRMAEIRSASELSTNVSVCTDSGSTVSGDDRLID